MIFQEGSAWVSQCVDLDLNGQGSNIHEAIRSLTRIFEARAWLNETRGSIQIRPAPFQFGEMFRNALPLKEPTRILTMAAQFSVYA